MRLGVSEPTIRRRVADGSLRAVKLGDSRNCAVRIPRSALDEWLHREATL
jgi:excisionase family DNA binding protein